MYMQSLLRTAIAAACFMFVGAAAAQPVTLKLGTIVPPQAPFIQNGLQAWIDAVTEDANGTIKIELFAGGSLVRHPGQQLSMVRNRIAEIGLFPNNTAPGQFPDDDVFELPLGPLNSFEASQAVWKLYEQGKLRGYDDFVVLGFLANGPALLQTNFKVNSIADLRNRNLRTATTAQTALIRELGANPIGSIPVTSAAESVSRGMIEGGMHNWGGWAAFRLDRVLSNHVELPMGYSLLTLAMNRRAWDGLPDEAKAAFEKHSFGNASAMFGRVDDGVAAAIRGRAADGDNHIVEFSEAEEARWRAAMQRVVDDWRQTRSGGDELYQALEAALNEIRAQD